MGKGIGLIKKLSETSARSMPNGSPTKIHKTFGAARDAYLLGGHQPDFLYAGEAASHPTRIQHDRTLVCGLDAMPE